MEAQARPAAAADALRPKSYRAPLRKLAEKRQDHEGVGLDPGALAHLLRLRQVNLGHSLVPGIEIKSSEAIVAGEEQLRLADLFGQAQRFLIGGEGQSVVAVALVDLAQDDQRNRQVIEEPQSSVEVDGLLRRLNALRLASVGQRAIGNGKVGIEARLEAEVAHLLRCLQPAVAGLDAAARVERAVEHAEVCVAATGRLQQIMRLGEPDALLDLADCLGEAAGAR